MAKQLIEGTNHYQISLFNEGPNGTLTIVTSEDGEGFDVFRGELTNSQQRMVDDRVDDFVAEDD